MRTNANAKRIEDLTRWIATYEAEPKSLFVIGHLIGWSQELRKLDGTVNRWNS